VGANPKPYLEYLDKEMTIMGVLSAFSVALSSFATEKIVGADKGFLRQLWDASGDHLIVGAGLAVIAAYFFYLQRSHLAWYYGQIALAESLGSKSAVQVENWLASADCWDTWVRYHAAFAALTVSFAAYAYAVAGTLNPWLGTVPKIWSLWIPLFLAALFTGWRWHVFVKFAEADDPVKSWWQSFQRNR